MQNELTFTNTGEQQKVVIVLEYHVGDDPEPTPDPVSADLSYGSSEADNVVLGEAYTARTLTNPYNVDVTYSSSNTSVATVNQQGAVTIVGAGETKITATFAGNDEYLAGSASYDIVVTMPVGISNVNADADADEVFYNTSGQKVDKNTPGILIKDGKKYMK